MTRAAVRRGARETFDLGSICEDVWFQNAKSIQKRPRSHTSGAEGSHPRLSLIKAADADDIDQISWIVERSLERSFVADG